MCIPCDIVFFFMSFFLFTENITRVPLWLMFRQHSSRLASPHLAMRPIPIPFDYSLYSRNWFLLFVSTFPIPILLIIYHIVYKKEKKIIILLEACCAYFVNETENRVIALTSGRRRRRRNRRFFFFLFPYTEIFYVVLIRFWKSLFSSNQLQFNNWKTPDWVI